jgi:MoaA/NifB/PqqE/SkfB family radical SAM enzyme
VEAKELNTPQRKAATFVIEVPLSKLRPGWYTCQVNVVDDAGGAFAFPRMPLLIKQAAPAQTTPAAASATTNTPPASAASPAAAANLPDPDHRRARCRARLFPPALPGSPRAQAISFLRSHIRMDELSPIRKKLRLLKAYLRGYPIWVSWQVTYACNFHCLGCQYWKEEVNFSREAREREASPDDFRVAAAKLSELGSLLINLAGGEPFLRQDLPEIVHSVAAQHFPMLTTNGWLVTEHNARALWDAGLWGISVSLDFSDPGAHDAQRGRRGAAERARRALQILSRTRTRPWQRVNLMCVLNHRNMGEVEDLIRFAAAENASFMIQPYTPMKNGNTELVPRQKSSAHLLALKRLYRNFLSNPCFLEKFDRFYEDHGIADCKAGQAFFNIDNYLNVQKCVEFREESIGNLREMSAREMLTRLNQEHRRNQCKACWYNCRGEIEVLYSATGLVRSLPTLMRQNRQASVL